MCELLEAPNAAPDIEDQWFFLHLIFENIEKYQFLYKDIVHVLGQHDNIKQRFYKIVQKKKKATLRNLKGLQEQGIIEANDDELEALCENIVLTATFWINYCIVSRNKNLSEGMLARGVYQVISLVAPLLDKEQRLQLNELKQAYL
jgi:hypothetical protein